MSDNDITDDQGGETKGGGSQAGAGAQVTLSFVNAIPKTEDEKAELRVAVWVNAAKYRWRHGKRSRKRRNPSGAKPRRISSKPDKGQEPKTHSSPRSMEDLGSMSIVRSHSGLPLSLESYLNTPMQTFPANLPRETYGDLMNSSVHNLPYLLLDESQDQGVFAADLWHARVVHNRPLFFAFMFASASYIFSCKGLPINSDSPVLLYNHGQAITELNKVISDPSSAYSDEIILAVTCLAFNGLEPAVGPPRAPAQGPLKSLQMLDIYGALKSVPMHAMGLAMLIMMRGGLQTLKLRGLAPIISYAGILDATRNLTQPFYPFIPTGTASSSLVPILHPRDFVFTKLGRGFSVLQEHQLHNTDWETTQQLCEIIDSIGSYTVIVNDYCSGSLRTRDLSLIANRRNALQHRLLSLPPQPQLQPPDKTCIPFYELSRLATIIYSLIAVFPLPKRTAPFAALAQLIKEKLSAIDVSKATRSQRELLLWIATMAALAALALPERSWFVSSVDAASRSLAIHDSNSARDLLENFLWYGPTSNVDLEELWREIEQPRAT